MNKVKVNGEFFDWEPEMTLTDLLKKIAYPYHPLAIRINGKLVDNANYNQTSVPSDSEVQIIRIISGG